MAIRYGLFERVEIGGALQLLGFSFDSQIRVTQSKFPSTFLLGSSFNRVFKSSKNNNSSWNRFLYTGYVIGYEDVFLE